MSHQPFLSAGHQTLFPKMSHRCFNKKKKLGAFYLPVFPQASLIPLISFASSCHASQSLWWACLPVYNTWRYSFFFFLFLPLLPKVWVLWTRLSGGELPWNLDRQSPVWSHLLRRGGTEGPRKLHESAPEDWGHSGDAYRGSGKACSRVHKWYRVSKSGRFLKMLTRQRGKTRKNGFDLQDWLRNAHMNYGSTAAPGFEKKYKEHRQDCINECFI